jgi:hypothetical protein
MSSISLPQALSYLIWAHVVPIRIIESLSSFISNMEKITPANKPERIKDLKERVSYIEDYRTQYTVGKRDVNLPMAILGINAYSTIDNFGRDRRYKRV